MDLKILLQTRERLITATALAIVMIICFALYVPGLSGEFFFDDVLNIVLNRSVHMQNLSLEELGAAFDSGIASDFGRPLAMVTFAFNHLLTGLNPYYFKLTNIFIHLITAVALYVLTCQLLTIQSAQRTPFRVPHKVVAFVITAAWTLHPLQVSTVLYIVQRMTQLSALMSVLAVIVYCRARQQTVNNDMRIIYSHAVVGSLIVVGILFKETAALTVLYIAAVEFALFRDATKTTQQRRYVYSFFAIFLALPGIAALAFLLMNPGYILDGYAIRSFTLWERLLTECRVIWDYIGWILIPDARNLTFYHEDFVISSGLFVPPVTAFAVLGILLLGAGAIALRKRLPWLCFGIAFFLVGHLLEGTIVALELVFEHRNYLPAYGLLFALFATLFSTPFEILSARFTGAFAALILVLFMDITYGETLKWSSTPTHTLGIYRFAPDSPRINYSMGSLFTRNGYAQQDPSKVREAQKYYYRMMELSPGAVIPFAAYIRNASWLDELPAPDIREQFLRNLRRSHFTPSDILELFTFIDCFYSNKCRNLGPLVIELYRAVGDNEVMTPAQKQRVLDEFALNLLIQFKRIGDALALYYFAESLSSELSLIDIKIIMLELDRRQPDAARAHLVKSRRKTITESAYKDSLDELEEAIASFPAGAPVVTQ